MAGLYIHIPFCASRCIYCGFYSTTLRSLQDRYVSELGREMELRTQDCVPHHPAINTIYLGGGTPSQLSKANLQRLFLYINKVYDTRDVIETTIECNPDDLNEEMVETLSKLPVNRISMGVQTFSDERLHFLHRRHKAADVKTAIERLRAIGIRNISIDLMFGFPGETIDEWRSDIDKALALDVEHISAYNLMYEEGTTLYELWQQQKVIPLGEEQERKMYETLINHLATARYEHYEISNFAKPGFRSRHNSSYWNETPYIGIGAAAHSYDRLSRRWNISNLHAYMEAIEGGTLPETIESIDEDTRYNDLITTAMRTKEGVDVSSLSDKHRDYLLANIQPSLQQKLVSLEDQRLRLTRKGLFVSDAVMSDLMYV